MGMFGIANMANAHVKWGKVVMICGEVVFVLFCRVWRDFRDDEQWWGLEFGGKQRYKRSVYNRGIIEQDAFRSENAPKRINSSSLSSMLIGGSYLVNSTKGVDWREHLDPGCLLAPAIVHPTRNSSDNSPGPEEHHLEMYTLVFVDPESSTHADEAQSSRVPVPLPKDPYEAIRQAYLDGTDTESEPFEDPTNTEITESPLAIAPPVLVPIIRRSACMAVHVPHAMSLGLSASMPEVAAMSESALRNRFREEDDDEEDEEIEESMDSDSVSEDAEDEGLTARVEGPGIDDEDYDLDDETHGRDDKGRGIDDEVHSIESDGLDLEEEESVPGGQRALRCRELALEEGDVYSTFEVKQGSGSAPESERPERVSAFRRPTLTTWTDLEDDMIYIDIPDYPPPAPLIKTPPSPEWTSGLLPISLSYSDVPSPISSLMIPLTVPYPIATPATVETEVFLTELGAQVEMQGGLIHDHTVRLEELSPALFERVVMTFEAIWSPLLAFEAWAGQTNAQRAALWYVVSVVQGENQDLRL
ncbi:hypothetical protein Tco_1473730 [Tanacetum coccineum]